MAIYYLWNFNMKKAIFFTLLLALCLVTTLGACAEKLSSYEVAEKFWTAVKENDVETMRKYVLTESLNKEDLISSLLPITNFKLGKIVIDGEKSWVETTVTVSNERPVTVPLDTVLAKENGRWKVRYDETVKMLSEASELAQALENFGAMTEQFSNKIGQSLDELQRSLPKVQRELKSIEEKLKAELPEIQKQLEGFAKELQDLFRSLEQTPPPEEEHAI
ncbi:hypothetical protein Noc_2135 [Nitrosococcus oceani ATCC 19707]|uniref:DUF4878 domain-containing protein n=3 Tax=Nitrosococcus oceani TaxID=1229 RepID=Q3J9A1_NITOC|nr:hypothetical protein Noc_2135 [Nitrosococcus oceani ATCC 19707]EDZ68084.1 hypothetical protein NOC27_1411 [Nitrosococcus oceani AFC27]KFI18896.1 hypothetical protein IB75_11385 [Nitrosococcus oceani C-27]GEM19715.1 hypothetical protein NONS58_11100 [Nitrosococcus oceani]